jgi:hypothetical protein
MGALIKIYRSAIYDIFLKLYISIIQYFGKYLLKSLLDLIEIFARTHQN